MHDAWEKGTQNKYRRKYQPKILFSSILPRWTLVRRERLIVKTVAGSRGVERPRVHEAELYRQKVLREAIGITEWREIQISLAAGSMLATERKRTRWKQSDVASNETARSLSSEKSSSGEVSRFCGWNVRH